MYLVGEGDDIFEFERQVGQAGADGKSGPLPWLTERERRAVRKDIGRVF
jgi:hypothetical protein